MRLVDSGKVEDSGTGGDVGPLRCEGHLPEKLAVQTRAYRLPVSILEQDLSAGSRIRYLDRCPFFVAEADREDSDPALCRFLCGLQGEGVVIFPVGDQNDRPGHVAGMGETIHRFTDRLLKAGAAASDASGSCRIENKPQETEIGGQG